MVIAMENKHIIQAFQEALADLPPAEQALKVLQFTERMQELEAADLERSAHSGVSQHPEGSVGPETRKGSDGARSGRWSGSNLPPGWEDIGEQKEDKDYNKAKNERRSGGKRLRKDTSKKVGLPVLIGVCVCLIVVIIIAVVVLRTGGSKPGEPNDPGEFESGYVEPAGAEGNNTDAPGDGTGAD